MRSSSYFALLAGSAAAQSTVTLFNFYDDASTLTLVGSDATATTYKNECPSGKAGFMGLPESDRPSFASTGPASASITPAPRVRFARQASASASSPAAPDAVTDDSNFTLCEPYTLMQGASTWSLALTDPTSGLYTVNANCKWQGVSTDADMTCTAVLDGEVFEATERGTSSSVLSKAEFSSMEAFHAVAIVTPTGSAAVSVSGSARPSQAPSGSGSPSTGAAPAGPLPTGAMALVGGAAGIFAAALAL